MADEVIKPINGSSIVSMSALDIAHHLDWLYNTLADQQAQEKSGDLFVSVEYRKRGEYIALFGLQKYGPVSIAQHVFFCKGIGSTWDAALVALSRDVLKWLTARKG